MPAQTKKYKSGIRFSATIQPKSSKNAIVGFYDNSLKIKLTAPPLDGAANKACVKFLAKQLCVSPATVSIISGLTGRKKTIQINDISEETFLQTIEEIQQDTLS
jgi:uncharacterized protein (TIGR00251 family)